MKEEIYYIIFNLAIEINPDFFAATSCSLVSINPRMLCLFIYELCFLFDSRKLMRKVSDVRSYFPQLCNNKAG